MTTRKLQFVVASVPASDGAGVKLRRSLGSAPNLRLDPFLMLDEFFSDDPDDYIAGFPLHPHRGFETVTYMLDGRMRHEDSFGNRGDLGPGDVLARELPQVALEPQPRALRHRLAFKLGDRVVLGTGCGHGRG